MMKVTVDRVPDTAWLPATSFHEGVMLINAVSSGIFIRINQEMIGFGKNGAGPWRFDDNQRPEWKLAPVGTKIILEQE